MSRFDSIEAQLNWGGKHIESLNTDIFAWTETDPYTMQVDPGYASKEHRIYITFSNEPDWKRWGLMLGDALSAMRTALDHLVYALAQEATSQKVPKGHDALEFPILSKSHYWLGGKDRRLKGLTGEMRTMIEVVQPYHQGRNFNWDGLWILRDLNNAAKHRLIHPVGLHILQSGSFKVVAGRGDVIIRPILEPLQNNATLYKILSADCVLEMQDYGQGPTKIGIPINGMVFELIPTLLALFERVATILRGFAERFFPDWEGLHCTS